MTRQEWNLSWNRRTKVALLSGIAIVYLIGIFIWGLCLNPGCYGVDYSQKFLAPSIEHWFGTDFMGRDMFYRCIKGLSNSLIVGVLAAGVSSILALILGIAAAIFGGWVDKLVNFCIDLCMGLPHLVLLILISFMIGKGTRGVTIAVALTHWPGLARIVRAEVLQVRSSQYVQAAYKMGKTKVKVAITHIMPHVLPSYLIGLILLFPHAIMHEASITFLGFVILSEAMNHIAMGKWWLALFPGMMLLIAVILFDVIGEHLKKLWNPMSGNE